MSFRDRNWNARFAAMGDQAEAKFEEVCTATKRGFVRYGLNRPPLRMSMLPPFVRYTPDYLTSKAFVEVQGFGRDQTFKMKVDKLDTLYHQWSAEFDVYIFVYDSHRDRHATLSISEVYVLCMEQGTREQFPEGKEYFALPAAVIFGEADDAEAA